MGSLTLASREKLDNLIFVVNCNLQRLDGPVRGNGKIIQELEAAFRGAGWNMIKVIWGCGMGHAAWRATQPACCSSAWAKWWTANTRDYKAKGGAYIRKEFFGKYPELLELVSRHERRRTAPPRRGGHDPMKVYTAYKRAVETPGPPDRDSGQDRQGLRPGRSRRRPQHHAPAEEAQRDGAHRNSVAL